MTTTTSVDSAGTANLAFLEELFDQYQNDPVSVPPDWRRYFESLAVTAEPASSNGHAGNGHAGNGQPVAGAGPASAMVPAAAVPLAVDNGQQRPAAASAGKPVAQELLDDDTMRLGMRWRAGKAYNVGGGEWRQCCFYRL